MTTENWREELRKSLYERHFSTTQAEESYLEVEAMIDSLLSKERNEAYEKGFTTGREGVELACKEAMKLNYWDKEKRNEVIDEVKKEVEELYEVCDICENQQQHDTEYNRTIDSVINILENLKVK